MEVGTGSDAHSCFPLDDCLNLVNKAILAGVVLPQESCILLVFTLRCATDHTVNFCVYPPSKPGTQDTLAWFISVVMMTEDTA